MRKFSLFMLMAVGLLISSNVGAVDVSSPAELNKAIETPNAQITLTQSFVLGTSTYDLNGATIDCGANRFNCSTYSPTLKNGTLKGTSYVLYVYNTGTMTLENMTITSTGNYPILVKFSGNSTINIKDCNIAGKNNVMYINGTSVTLNVTNKISDSQIGIGVTNSGSYTCNWTINKPSQTLPSNISINKLTVDGTTFEYNGGSVTTLAVINGGHVDLKSGTWANGSITEGAANCTAYAGVTIGLDYRSQVAVPEGYKYDANGKVVIDGIDPAQAGAKIGETYYEDFAAAMAAVQSGETITLLKDYIASKSFEISETITIDVKGATFTGYASDNTFKLSANGHLTIIGNKNISASKVLISINDATASATIKGATVSVAGTAIPCHLTVESGKATIFSGTYHNNGVSTLVGADKCIFKSGVKAAYSDREAVEANLSTGDLYCFYEHVNANSSNPAYDYCEVKKESDAVVEMVGGKKFLTFFDACALITDDHKTTTLKLLKSYTSGKVKDYQITGDNIILDLNGQTIIGAESTEFALRNNSGHTSTAVMNGTLKGNGKETGTPLRLRYDNVTLEDLTLDADGNFAAIELEYSARTLIMKNVAFQNATQDIVCTFNEHPEMFTAANLNMITEQVLSLKNKSEKLPVIINTGNFKSIVNVENAKSLTLDGGSYSGTITNDGTMIIKQGNFNNITFGGTKTIDIYGGTFVGTCAGNVTLYGGVFTDKTFASSHLASGYKIVETTSSTLGDIAIVLPSTAEPIFKNLQTSTTYYTLENAIDALVAGQTIQLIGDYNATVSTTINKQFTLDLNNNSITGDASNVFVMTDEGNMTIQNGTINVTNDIFYAAAGKLTLKNIKGTSSEGYCINEEVKVGSTAEVIVDKDCQLEANLISAIILCSLPRNSANTKGSLDIYGQVKATTEKETAVTVNGLDQSKSDLNIHVYSSAKLIGDENVSAIYLAGYAKSIIDDGAEVTGCVDIRAGELTINGGTFVCPGEASVEFDSNNDGSARTSGSCNIAIAQHVTKLPTIVTINGGTFTAVSPIAQGNPQANDEHSAELVKCYINGGHFWSTSMTTDDILVSQEDNRIFATAGFYNEKPVDKVISKGYQALSTETEYPTEWSNNYKWYIGLPSKQGETSSTTGGDWNTPDTWDGKKTPNENLEVIINGNVTLNGDGYAYGVKLEEGGKLTIQDGGTLIIGQGGVTGATIENLKIDGDGIFAIAPGTEFHPNASIDYVAKWAGKKKNVTEVSTVDQVYWEQMATPTIDDIQFKEPTEGCGGKHYYNKWDITEAWVAISKDEVNTPFKGYFMTNFSDYNEQPKNNVYNFTGTLAGNKINPFGFNREGFTFFGNSCLAPMSIPELLMDLNKDDIQATIYVYQPLQGSYHTINMATVGRGNRPVEINKLQGFFIYAYKKTNVAPTYQDIIWNPLLAKQTMGGNSAPHKAAMAVQSEISSAATMTITSAMGWTDDVVLFEGANFTNEFDQNYDAQKMSGDHVNVYVPSTQNMAVYAVANLEGTPITIATKDEVAYTFSFSDVEGRGLELFDAETQIATKMQEGNTYEFVAPANSKIEYRFFIRKAAQAPTNNETVRNAAKVQGIYNVMGAYMGETKQWNTLPAGVYIVNGVRVAK